MEPLFYIIVFLSYLILAGIVAIALPFTYPGAQDSLGLAMGGVVFLMGALVHLAHAFFESRRRLHTEIIRLRADQSSFMNQRIHSEGIAQLILEAGAVPPAGMPQRPGAKGRKAAGTSQAE